MGRSEDYIEFRPMPLLGNPHVQTVLASLLPARAPGCPTETRAIELEDGDRIVVQDRVPVAWRPKKPVAVLVHGLAGSHRSGYMKRTGRRLLRHGIRVYQVDLRGAGVGIGLARRPYHGGCSEDVRTVLEQVSRWCPDSPISLIGFSLGGNIVLKLAGEAAERPLNGLERVAALAPPIDFERCADLLALPGNAFYERFFVRSLLRQARRRQRYFPEDSLPAFPRRLRLRSFDDLYTAPRSGFDNVGHYYRSAASLPWIPRIELPTFIITARDDPFIAVESFENLRVGSHMQVHIVPSGGHLGFLGFGRSGIYHWAEERIAEWVVGTSSTT
jgi:predicted alpha/beta-fold hydrolase